MNRTIRALRADPLRAGCLLAATAAAVAGAGCIVAYGARGPAGGPTAATLSADAAIGVLATAVLVTDALHSRAPEIAVAVVRGMSAVRTWRWLSGESLVVAATGTIAGLLVSVLAWRLLDAAGRGAPERPGLALLAGVGAGGCCLLTALGCCVRAPAVIRSGAAARRTPVLLAAAEAATVVGAAWLLYQAASAGPGRHAMLASFAPAAAALAALVASGRVSRVVGRVGMLAWSHTRDLSRFLAARRLGRATALAVSLASVTGASAIGLYAGIAQHAESRWRDQVANVRTGGVTAFDSDLPASATFLATRAADPDGRWLMAIVASAPDSDPGEYRGYADLTRWPRVVGGPWDTATGTDTRAVRTGFGDDSWQPVTIPRGTVRIAVDNHLRRPGDERAFLNLSLLQRDGDLETVPVPVAGRGSSVLRAHVHACAEACTLRKITIGTGADAPLDVHGSIVLRSITTDGPGNGWTPGGERRWAPDLATASHGGSLDVRTTAEGLRLRPAATGLKEPVGVVPSRAHLERRVLVAGDTDVGHRVLGLDSSAAPASVVARYPMLPLLGTHGYLGDLPDVLLDSFDAPVGSRVRVLARDDTPHDVLRALDREGVPVGEPRSAGEVAAELGRSDDSRAVLSWSVLAVVAAVAGLAVAVHSESTARPRTRHDSASLRVAHVPPPDVIRTVGYEVALVSIAAAVPSAVLGLATWWCVRRVAVPGDPAPFEPRVDVSVPWLPAVLAVVVTFGLSAGCVLALRRGDTARGRPEILRTTGTPR